MPVAPPRVPTIVQPQLIIGIPVGGSDPAAKVEGDAWNPKASDRRVRQQRAANVVREFRCDSLVGVDRQNPIVLGKAGGKILLIAVPVPGPHEDASGVPTGDGYRVVVAL